MRKLLLILLLAGCGDGRAMTDAQALVASELKDPDSAQFRNMKRYGDLICGEVNAKNSYGGYVGFQPFYVRGTEVALHSETGDDLVDVTSRGRILTECAVASTAELNSRLRSETATEMADRYEQRAKEAEHTADQMEQRLRDAGVEVD